MSGGTRAPSLCYWLQEATAREGDILYHDVMVPSEGVACHSYYCTLQWNIGGEGGAYCGIQQHPNGRNYIFSIWDPSDSNLAIQPHKLGDGTTTERFGGEGTGLKSWNFSRGWDTDSWITTVVRRWGRGDRTMVGLWAHETSRDRWWHMATLDYPIGGVHFRPGTACFLEDWYGNGHEPRKVIYRDGFKRGLDGVWSPFYKADFGVNREESVAQFQDNYDAGFCQERSYFLHSGSKSLKPSPGLGYNKCFDLEKRCCESPPKPAISFSARRQSPTKVAWTVPESSTPQFRYEVKVAGRVAVEDVDPDKREVNVYSGGDPVEVTLEDILGRKVAVKVD